MLCHHTKLGTGAFSTVRRGYHRSNKKKTYAVKCVNRKKLTVEDEAALLDEVSILKEMKHLHIIRLYDFFKEQSTYYLVMEEMDGGELFDRIVAKAYYNEKEARDTCKIVLEAVGYMHENNVAHRDLKPENLLLVSKSDDSEVKIADFGFAKKVYKECTLKTQCGTVRVEKAYIERRRSEGFIFLYYDDTHILFLPLLFKLFVSLIIIIYVCIYHIIYITIFQFSRTTAWLCCARDT